MSVVVTLAISNVLRTWSVSALTAPFVLVAWLLLLATNAFSGLEGGALPPVGHIVPIDPAAADPLRVGDFLQGMFTSITQVFLKGYGPSALLFLAGLAVNSLTSALFALVGALVAVVTAHLLGAESELVTTARRRICWLISPATTTQSQDRDGAGVAARRRLRARAAVPASRARDGPARRAAPLMAFWRTARLRSAARSTIALRRAVDA